MQKEITYWSPYSLWQRCTLTYEPLRKGGIEPSEHPAVKEDEWLRQPDIAKEKRWTQGHTKELVRRYLLENGPATIADIASEMDSKISKIAGALTRNPELFVVVGHKRVRVHYGFSIAKIWGLQDQGGAS